MIYLVEDDDNIRKLVSYALTKEGYDVKGFAVPSEFWNETKTEIPDLVMLDIMLPQEDGLSILKKLRTMHETEDLPIIMLTAKDSEFDKVTGLDLGADDYISKPFGMTELISRVKALLRRFNRLKTKKKTYEICALFVDPEKHIVKVDGEEITLSFKEYSLLLVLLEADGNVVSRDTLLTKIWGEYYDESRTLDVHIRKLRVKLKEAGSLIKTVKNVGYRIGGEENDA
ncbi:MAG: response regulator transcription factor [Clostridiales bacterium]|nr:response regulator transcription factor [Clostridiales bacterium]